MTIQVKEVITYLKLEYVSGKNSKLFSYFYPATITSISHNNIVYRISCRDCNVTYIGQSKRQLGTRIAEHKNDIKKSSNYSVISEHRLNCNHDFNWENVEILDEEGSYKRRLISEMLSIKRQKSGLNKQSDTEFLSDAYIPVLNMLPPL